MIDKPGEKQNMRRLYMSYIVGFGLSLMLTVAAFAVTILQVQSGGAAYPNNLLVFGLVGLAIVQLVVQLLFFFHLGREEKPRLNTISFLFMLMVVGIIGFGSLWIMYNLDYNMTPRDVEEYIQEEENIQLDKVETEHNH
jgi:cytochrome o ubiquinol oxidase operon protein cyoD